MGLRANARLWVRENPQDVVPVVIGVVFAGAAILMLMLALPELGGHQVKKTGSGGRAGAERTWADVK